MRLLFLVPLLVLGACARDPIIDPRSPNAENFQADLAECRLIADRAGYGETVATNALVGAGVGAALGAIIGAFGGGAGRGAALGAAIGGVAGTARGGQTAEFDREVIIRNCLRNRGHIVLR